MTSRTSHATETSPPPRRRQGGFTLIEVTIVVAIAVPMLVGISTTTATVNHSVEAHSRAADVMAFSLRMSQRMARLVRPAKLSTLQVPAVAEDVAALRASTIGEWIPPTDLVWRPGIEFRAASGLLSMNAALSTERRRMLFAMDPAEAANGIDDDGDGLVDEGMITLDQNLVTLDILRDVEDCSFMIDGRIVHMRLRIVRRGSDRRIYEYSIQKPMYLRNN